MSVQQDPITPTKWYFIGNPAFTWTPLGAQPIWVDDTDRGADHSTGTGGAINTPFGDIYDRLGYLFRGVTSAGNRGYSQNTIKNATGALLPTDSGLITVQTAPVGTAPTAAVTLTLPTRAALVAANVGYFQSIASPPYFNVAGSGLFPFMINGYTNNAGVPLAITVANPTTPGTPVAGMDVAQRIQIGALSATTIYLYAGDYAEFIPVISNDVNNYWYLTWTVRVHNSNYQKFTKGGSVVAVGTNAYPSTNMDGVSNYFNFSITAAANLSWMPDSSVNSNYSRQVEGSRLLYVKVNTIATGNAWTLKNNVASPPTGYKPIITPTGADMPMNDGDILVMIEDGANWVVASIIGSTSNFAYLESVTSLIQGELNTEITNRGNADTALKNLLVSGSIGGGVSNLSTLTTEVGLIVGGTLVPGENDLVSLFAQLPLVKGKVQMGGVTGLGNAVIPVTFSSVGATNYYVLLTPVFASALSDAIISGLSFSIVDGSQTATGFSIKMNYSGTGGIGLSSNDVVNYIVFPH